MRLRSLGYRTDLIFARYAGVVEDLGDALAITSPRNPSHYFGNLIVFDRPPAAGDLAGWEARFARHVGRPPLVNHVLFGWDAPDGALGDHQAFLKAGYTLEENLVMTAPALTAPPRPNWDAVFRALGDDEDWGQALENQIACREGWEADGYRAFKATQMRRYREMSRAGLGRWYGAFLNGRLVADLGVYVDAGTARFQAVGTHPGFRRRGLCATLVHFAGEDARRTLGAAVLVIVADDHYVAKDIYRSVGFRQSERQACLLRAPRA